jgi:hypothetical protein
MVDRDGQISEAELAAFADGSRSPRRRAQIAACIERSPELHVLVGARRAALAAVRTLDAPAPAGIRALRPPEPSRPPSRRAEPSLLNAAIAGVPFPNYAARLGRHATGTRADELDGRQTRTVFYAGGDRRIAYSIVTGHALAWPVNAWRTRRDGTELRHRRRGEQTIVTWLRAGHTCVLSGARLSRDELLELATWNGSMDIARIHTSLSPTSLHELAA